MKRLLAIVLFCVLVSCAYGKLLTTTMEVSTLGRYPMVFHMVRVLTPLPMETSTSVNGRIFFFMATALTSILMERSTSGNSRMT